MACMQGHCSAQKLGHQRNFLWMTWHSLSSAQLSLHLWGEPKFTPLSLSFHPHPQQYMDPNGVVLWLPSSTTVPPLEANKPLEIVNTCLFPLNYEGKWKDEIFSHVRSSNGMTWRAQIFPFDIHEFLNISYIDEFFYSEYLLSK